MNTRSAGAIMIILGLSVLFPTGSSFGEGVPAATEPRTPTTNESGATSKHEILLQPGPGNPNGPMDDDENTPASTLELRFSRQTCRGVAQLWRIAQKCHIISYGPLLDQ